MHKSILYTLTLLCIRMTYDNHAGLSLEDRSGALG